MKNIFKPKEEEKQEEKPETESQNQEEIKNNPVSKEQVEEKIKSFILEKNPSQSVKIILAKPLEFEDGQTLKIPINNKVEISMLQNIEQPLLDHLRNGLGNSTLQIEYNVTEHSVERKPYTSSEIFEAMAKKNPALLKLKEDMGLDTDY